MKEGDNHSAISQLKRQKTGHLNNFDFLRLVAAGMVWGMHSCEFYTLPHEGIIMFIGRLAVSIFFIISGYFITAGYLRFKKPLPFLRNRALRLLPALAAVTLICTFVIGPLMTVLPLYDYFTRPQTWRYLLSATALFIQYDLPGVFTDNLGNHAVNNSLWTLTFEVACYTMLLLVGLLNLLRPRVMFVIFVLFWGIHAYFGFYAPQYLANRTYSNLERVADLFCLFAGGSFLYLMRGKIPLRRIYFALALLVLAASIFFSPVKILFDAALIYAVIYFGSLSLPVLQHFSRYGDFSYGFYLYAWPVQQLTWHFLGGGHFAWFLIITFSVTMLCAISSWHIVEKPMLALKK